MNRNIAAIGAFILVVLTTLGAIFRSGKKSERQAEQVRKAKSNNETHERMNRVQINVNDSDDDIRKRMLHLSTVFRRP